jgi:hypothetical protein
VDPANGAKRLMHRGIDWKKTRERAQKREEFRSRIGYIATGQFAALNRELDLIPRVADDVRDKLATSTEPWIWMLRGCDPDILATTALNYLMNSIMLRHDHRKACLRLGRAVHGELWAVGLLKTNRRLHTKVRKTPRKGDRIKAAIRADYWSKEWNEEQTPDVGNWLIDAASVPFVTSLRSNG